MIRRVSRLVSAEEARGLLTWATRGPWYVDSSGRGVEYASPDIGAVEVVAWTARGDTKLIAAAPDLAATVIALSEERDHLRATLYREGYAPCSSAACNCGGWHR